MWPGQESTEFALLFPQCACRMGRGAREDEADAGGAVLLLRVGVVLLVIKAA